MIRTFKTMGLLLLMLAASFQNQLFAQGRQITGTVTSSENKQPLAGITVTVKGTRTATNTDAQGNFKLKVDDNATTLVFTSASYITYEVTIGSNATIDAVMQPDTKSLSDVVVIGYQTVRRKDLLASVSSVSSKDLKDIPINSAAEALNGRLAGVTATTAEGSPDAEIRIRVRGGMSITGDNSPLYIVDGVQVENGLSTISPQDIQSIDVLKDAAATAIYGARGANGVIVITTKSGKPGKLILNYNGFIGVKSLSKKLKVMSPYEYVIYQFERSRGSSTDSTSFAKNFGTTWDTLSNYKNVDAVDWQDEVFGNTGITTTHNISGSGGTNKMTYNFGYTYNNDKAIVINSNYKRHLFNLKGDYKITKNLKVGVGGRFTHQDVYGAGVSDAKGSSYNRLRNAVKYRPYLSTNQDIDDPDLLADPNVGNGLNLYNPIALANAEYRKKTTDAYNVTAFLTYTIVKNLTFKSTFGYDWNKLTDLQYSDSLTPYSIISGARKPIAGLDTTTKKTLTNSNVLTYSIKGFKNKHDFDFLIGEETYDLQTESRSSLFRNFPTFTSYNTAFKQTDLGVPFTGYPKLGKTRYTSLSFFGRLTYGYREKYLFSFDMREDGASKFGPGHKWGNFPAGSVAWRVSKEKFMQNVGFINDLKFRAGFGTIGNNRITDYLYLTSFRNDGTYFYGLNNQAILAYYSNSLVNPDLKWESTVNRNYGVDISMFKNKVNLSVDYYNNTSKDLLLNVPIASTFGYSTQLQNIGKTSNKGVEVQLNATLIKKADFSWSANFNISFNKNKILALGKNQQSFFPAASWGVSGQPTDYIERVGDPVGSIWGLVTAGFYTVDDFNYNPTNSVYTLRPGIPSNASIIGTVMPGSIRFSDLNNDGVVDITNDRRIIGNPTPKFTGGLNQQFTWKQWDMSLFLNFSSGNDVYNANKIEFTNGYTGNANQLAIMENRWRVVTPSGQTALYANSSGQAVGIAPDLLNTLNANATIWQPLRSAGAFYPHSWAIEDGSFLRINNLSLGYSLPVRSLAGLKMSKLRFYFTGNNIATFTKYTGYDPEVSVRSNPLTPGLDYSAYPKSRSFIFGVNATF
ncbi:MAG: TonB-dependent receptor [Chitinophagaceae bacterium]|nr:TonB-dependent receptor [Chitinophagaceae bacterium]MBL0272073.1 TonB-dependent receptor [Chitinophagaceae bacterium]